MALRGPGVEVVLSAYADDVLLMFTDPADLARMRECQAVYSAASSARINWAKCSGLLVGQWRMDDLPEELRPFTWSRTNLLYLGVHLCPAEESWPANWQELEEKVSARLRRWTGLLRVLSYRARVLVINQLITSMLWYRLVTLTPPPDFVLNIQRTVVRFFWDNRLHWIPVEVLKLPIGEGGQALVCVRTQVATFRLQTLQRYLYVEPPPKWRALATYFFRQVNGLNYDVQLLYIGPVQGLRPSLQALPVFYRDLLKVWNTVATRRSSPPSGAAAIFREPLLGNPLLHQCHFTWLTRRRAADAGVTRIGDVLGGGGVGWMTPHELAERAGVDVRRAAEAIQDLRTVVLGPAATNCLEVAQLCGGLPSRLTPDRTEFHIGPKPAPPPPGQVPHNLSRLAGMPSVPFKTARRDFLYGLLLHTLHFRFLARRPDSRWRALLPPGGGGPQWRSFYGGISPQYLGDLGWRLVHAAVPYNRRLSWFTDSQATCHFCNLEESVDHVYLDCFRLHSLFCYLKNLLLKFCLHFSPTLLIHGHPVRRGAGRAEDHLVNLLLDLARYAINRSRQRATEGVIRPDCVPLFRGYVRGRVSLEKEHAESSGELHAFRARWAPQGLEVVIDPFNHLLV